MTTSDYLEQLTQDRDDLVDNLTEKGITGLTGDETFTELVPEVLNIPSGVDPTEFFQPITNNLSGTTNSGKWINFIDKFIITNNINITNFSQGFNNFGGLSIEGLNKITTVGCSNFSNLFYKCGNIKSVDISTFDFSNATNIQNMFGDCWNLETITGIENIDTTNIETFNGVFASCRSLKTLNISTFDFSKVKASSYNSSVDLFLGGCRNLENLTFGSNLGKGYTQSTADSNYATFDLSGCPNLTHNSLIDVINKLYDLAGNNKPNQKLILGATNLAKLSSAEIQIATDKGWDVS